MQHAATAGSGTAFTPVFSGLTSLVTPVTATGGCLPQ